MQAEGREIRHGIYRDFPLTFRDAGGTLREVDFSLLGVERDGRPETYSTTRQHGIIRIYAGDKDTTVRYGEHTYVFRYQHRPAGPLVRRQAGTQLERHRQFLALPDFVGDLSLCNLSRAERPCAGPPLPAGSARAAPIGEAASALSERSPSRPRGRLAPGEGLTVVAEIPATPSIRQAQNTLLWYEIFDNRQWIFGGLGLVLVLGLLPRGLGGRRPRSQRRHHHPAVLIHPTGISPALANYIHNWGFGREKWRAFTAAALSLAVKGLLRFDDRAGIDDAEVDRQGAAGWIRFVAGGRGRDLTWVNDEGGAATISSAHSYAVAKARR